MNVVLIGLSGSGKSTVGRVLADSLGWRFVDTDAEIVSTAGKPIHRIFAEDGEAAFRALEASAVAAALSGDETVISLGGGAVMNPATRALLGSHFVVFLDAPSEVLAGRLRASDAVEPRPLLAGEDPIARLEALRAARSATYRSLAHATIPTADQPIHSIVARIANAVGAGRRAGQPGCTDELPPHRHPEPGRAASPGTSPHRHPERGQVLSPETASLSEGSAPRTIPVRTATGTYSVLLGRDLLARAGDHIRTAALTGRARVIADEAVFTLYGAALEAGLRRVSIEVASTTVPTGEASKSLEVAAQLYDWLLETSTERGDFVVALGGGVAGDLAGFVAATYLRGLRLVQVPTSLLAQVDSSVGGKVAIDLPRGKNLVGAFYPPSLVLADTATLSTLPRRELSAGLAEVAKHGVILDEKLFRGMEAAAECLLALDRTALDPIVARSIEIKARVVEQDERESGLRAILNYGHTIGHAVEAVTGFDRFRHGEAVSIGMAGAAQIAVRLGMLTPAEAARQDALLTRLALPTTIPALPADQILAAMTHDKKANQGRLSWVLPESIGRVTIRRDVPLELVKTVLMDMGATALSS